MFVGTNLRGLNKKTHPSVSWVLESWIGPSMAIGTQQKLSHSQLINTTVLVFPRGWKTININNLYNQPWCMLCWQVVMQFDSPFWREKTNNADVFGHVPSEDNIKRDFSVFYDLSKVMSFLVAHNRFFLRPEKFQLPYMNVEFFFKVAVLFTNFQRECSSTVSLELIIN